MKKTIYISGMKCNNCAMKVKNSLMELSQVEKASVNPKSGKAVVKLNEDIEDNILKEAVEKNNYQVTKIKKNLF
jgi:hypothetical protein